MKRPLAHILCVVALLAIWHRGIAAPAVIQPMYAKELSPQAHTELVKLSTEWETLGWQLKDIRAHILQQQDAISALHNQGTVPLNDMHQVAYYALRQGVIDFERARKLYTDSFYATLLENLNVYHLADDQASDATLREVAKAIGEFIDALKSGDTERAGFYVEQMREVPDLTEKKNRLYPTSIERILGHMFGHLPANSQTWIIDQQLTDIRTFAGALASNAGLDSLQQILDTLPSINMYYLDFKTYPRSPLRTPITLAIHAKRWDVVDYILENFSLAYHGLSENPANALVTATQDGNLAEHAERFTRLAEQKIVVEYVSKNGLLWMSDRDKIVDLRALKAAGIPSHKGVRTPRNISPPVSVTAELDELSQSIKSLMQEKQDTQRRLKALSEQRKQLIPQPNGYVQQKKIVFEAYADINQRVNAFRDIEPAWVDFYLSSLLAIPPEETDEKSNDLLNNFHAKTIDKPTLLAQASALHPHQQRPIIEQLCQTQDDLISLMESGWVIQFITLNDACMAHYLQLLRSDDAIGFTDNSAHSAIIADATYRNRAVLIQRGFSVRGFAGGRDALATLLDEINADYNTLPDVHVEAIEALLTRTELTDMHLPRWQQMQLLFPQTVKHLRERFTALKRFLARNQTAKIEAVSNQ